MKTVQEYVGDAIDSLDNAKLVAFQDIKKYADNGSAEDIQESLDMIEDFDKLINNLKEWQ